jgi:hypothetical protein
MRYLHMSLGSADIVGGGQPEAAWEFLGENGGSRRWLVGTQRC